MRRTSSANGPAWRSAIMRPTWQMRAGSSGGAPGTSRPRKVARKVDRGMCSVCQVASGAKLAW